jgi:hypothetical protein
MKRWLFNIVSAVSLLLCSATCVLWVRSYWVADEYRRVQGVWPYSVKSTRGALECLNMNIANGPWSVGHLGYSRQQPGRTILDWEFGSLWATDPGITSAQRLPGISWRFTNGGRSVWRSTMPVSTRPSFPPPVVGTISYFIPRRDVWVSDWAVVLLFALTPAAATLRWVVARRSRIGECSNCGYDLRATPDRCPECGTFVASRPCRDPC